MIHEVAESNRGYAEALLAHWEIPINKGEVSLYCRFLKPGTDDFSADGKIIYQH